MNIRICNTKAIVPTSGVEVNRKDSSKGYIEGNVQWVHKKINIMKHASSDNEFINYCKLVVQHAKNPNRKK